MSTAKLIVFYIAWLFAAGAVAVTAAVLFTELLAALGLVGRSGNGYRTSLTITTAGCFVLLAMVPFMYRSRFQPSRSGATSSTEDPS